MTSLPGYQKQKGSNLKIGPIFFGKSYHGYTLQEVSRIG
jgi:hypothetical protein